MFPQVPDHESDGLDARAPLDGPTVEAALARLIVGDPLAGELVRSAARAYPDRVEIQAALALVSTDPESCLDRARTLAQSRRDRQYVAVVSEYLAGDSARTHVLARQHLAFFPDDVLISWLSWLSRHR